MSSRSTEASSPPNDVLRVIDAMLRQERQYRDKHIMVYYYVIKQLYALDEPTLDLRVLDLFRNRWAAMAASPWQSSWEGFDWGSHAHIYGMYPGYFLSAYVLGVRRDAPVAERVLSSSHTWEISKKPLGSSSPSLGPCLSNGDVRTLRLPLPSPFPKE